MRADVTTATLKQENREASAISLLHAHKDVILEALEHSENPLSDFVAAELDHFLA